MARAICEGKPVLLRKKARSYYACVDPRHVDDDAFASLKEAVGGNPSSLCGPVPELRDTYWREAIRLKLEERAWTLWLLLEPDVWITPLKQREKAEEFLRNRKLTRFNNRAYEILNAWIEVLLGGVGQPQPVTVTHQPGKDFPAAFSISTRTAYSGRSGR